MTQDAPYLLAIDTSTPCTTVALTSGTRKDGQVIAELSLSSNITHSRKLLAAIDRLLAESGIDNSMIGGYAIGAGPGSFTGLRIGMATAKGLAAASGLPLYPVSTLDVLAANCADSRLICAVLDARKKEVYSAFYRLGESGYTERVSDLQATAPESLGQQITEPVVMVGDGLHAYGELFQQQLGDLYIPTPAHLWSPAAGVLGLLGREQALSGEVYEPVPLYVRASDAELNLQMKKKKRS